MKTNTKPVERKVYGEDLWFVQIYEMIKMRMPISAKMKDYFLKEKKHYDL